MQGSTHSGRQASVSAMLIVAVTVLAACLVALLWWQAEPARSATTVPQGFTDSRVAQVPNPTSMALAPDGRLFVTQKGNNSIGRVRVIKKGQLLSKPFLNVTTDTSDFRGLLGVTLDPNFSTNHYVYIFYTATSPTVHNRVSRFTAKGDVAVAGSQKVILDLPALGNTGGHYGGSLRFGSDGKLYVGVGDDTTPADAQSLDTVNGKILRINRDGTIPADNPFFNSTSGDRRAIWALGLRQPYSLDVQSGTSKMYVNEVGEDAWEEIDEVTRGANYGWPIHEGATSSPHPSLQNYQNPLLAYGHGGDPATTGCAITGGVFYNPTTVQFSPESEYVGDYFFADLCNGWIRKFDPLTGQASGFASGIEGPVDLEVSKEGELYYLSRGAPGLVGKIGYAGS
jgi:glucose/arabinose dehydrogenase